MQVEAIRPDPELGVWASDQGVQGCSRARQEATLLFVAPRSVQQPERTPVWAAAPAPHRDETWEVASQTCWAPP